MLTVQMNIAIAEAGSGLELESSLVDNIKMAMNKTKDHWLCTDEDQRFRAAIGAVMMFYGEGSDEWKRISTELDNLRKASVLIGAMQVGLVVDIEKLVDSVDTDFEPIGLVELWHDIKKGDQHGA